MSLGRCHDSGAQRLLRLGAGLWLSAAAFTGPAEPARAQTRAVACEECHPKQAERLGGSVHRNAIHCSNCHGGASVYEVTPQQWQTLMPSQVSTTQAAEFDHGPSFRGRIGRKDVLEVCGTCHANIELMNPYGLRTDQLRAYWLSGHGKRLKQYGDDHVAVCIDCHGAHDVLSKADARSRTHFSNIPATCGRCHGDWTLMSQYYVSSDVPYQYSRSVHGINVLEKGDAGSPNCATCHGSHAAAPPGFAQVGHVCGQCHKQVEEYVLSSIHGRISVMSRCTGCHGKGGNPRNHQIEEATPSPEALVGTYSRLRREIGLDEEQLPAQFSKRLDETPGSLRPDAICHYCHGPGQPDPHSVFWAESDRTVLQLGEELTTTLRKAQLEYARTADRLAGMGRGVLLVHDEAVRAEDAKTALVALCTSLHAFDLTDAQQRKEKLAAICREVNDSLDRKEAGLHWRSRSLIPVWMFAAFFFVLMYRKYLQLKKVYIAAPGGVAVGLPGAPASRDRRLLLDTSLRALGGAAVIAVLYPAIVYILPARKRGGGSERISAGKAEGWKVWEVRKVAVAGRPVAVVLTDQGFRALSLVCTHLGCIVEWNAARREFDCPCHGASFRATGQVISGPPPRPLPEYTVAVIQGELIVTDAPKS